MKTLREIVESVDLEKHGECVYSEDLPLLFGIQDYVEFDDRLKMVYIRPHYCTDTWVGVRAYYLNEKFVAISVQLGRKWDEEFQFVSEEAFHKVKEYIYSLIGEEKFEIPLIENFDTPMDEYYSVEYAVQILHGTGIYEGEKVKINVDRMNREWDEFHKVKIIRQNGKEQIVDCRDIKLSYIDLS